MIFKNKKGAALLQVLLVTVILAGMATMLLRASLSRTTAARKTRRTVSAQMLVNSCMAQVNNMWAAKSPEMFARDMSQCIMYCKDASAGTCSQVEKTYKCNISLNGQTYTVTAAFDSSGTDAVINSDNKCKLTYTIESNVDVM